MGKAIGIDLGTTTCEISYIEDGKPVIIKNEKYGDGTAIPSVVTVKKDEVIVGKIAKRQLINRASSTVSEFKRYMGTDKLIKLFDKRSGFSKTYKPEEISAMLLKTLKQIAEEELGEVSEAVITVPANFNNAQRKATKEAARLSGLNVKRIINEPTAAAFAYASKNIKLKGNILVYDLGGGTFDCSILKMSEGVVEVKVSRGDNKLGGKDFDKRVENYIIDHIKTSTELDVNKLTLRQKNQIKQEAERAKKDLSVETYTEILINNLAMDEYGDSIDIELELTRSKFNSLTADLIKRSEAIIDNSLKDADITSNNIDYVLAVGGSSRMPIVYEMLKRKFGDKIQRGLDPDEAVAMGAAVQAGINNGDFKDYKDISVIDVCSHSLGVRLINDTFSAIIKRDSIVPIAQSTVYTTTADNQTSIRFGVYQGENETASKNEFIGEFTVGDIPELPKGQGDVEVGFEYDLNGMLSINATVLATGKVIKEKIKVI